MSAVIASPPESIWEALTERSQVLQWRPGAVEVLDPDASYPTPGERVRWRCLVRGLPLVLEDTPLLVLPGECLHARLSLGLFRFEETFRLGTLPTEPKRTRLGIKIAASNQMPVLGGALDRFAVREFATQLAATYLQAVRDWCEGSRRSQRALPSLPSGAAQLSAHSD